jgi:hypothetical protein
MSTVFDYLTMAIFAGLIVLYLKRSSDGHDEPQHDQIWQYFVAAVGCAVANYVGNHGYPIIAVALIVATMMFIVYALRPFPRKPPSI